MFMDISNDLQEVITDCNDMTTETLFAYVILKCFNSLNKLISDFKNFFLNLTTH